MKRLFSLLMVLTLAAALCLSVWADDSNPDSGINNGGNTSTVTTDNQGVYVTGYTVTTPAGGEITTLNVGDQVNIVLQVVDHSSARYAVKAEDIVARINSSIFTYTGTGEIGQLFESNDDPDQTRKDPQYNYYSYVLLFRDVIYNGGGNTLPINRGQKRFEQSMQGPPQPVRGTEFDRQDQRRCDRPDGGRLAVRFERGHLAAGR